MLPRLQPEPPAAMLIKIPAGLEAVPFLMGVGIVRPRVRWAEGTLHIFCSGRSPIKRHFAMVYLVAMIAVSVTAAS